MRVKLIFRNYVVFDIENNLFRVVWLDKNVIMVDYVPDCRASESVIDNPERVHVLLKGFPHSYRGAADKKNINVW